MVNLGGRVYGLPLARVEEVIAAVAITPLPEAQAFLEGVVNLRGQAVPVLNVRSRFQLPDRPVAPTDRFIVATASDRRVIIRGDAVIGLRDIDPTDITAAQDIGSPVRYVSGVACLADGVVLIQDLDTFLTDFERDVLDEIRSVSPP